MIDRHSFIQPTEFNQLDHERHFKLVFQKLFLATLSYALSALTLSHLTGEGKQIQSEKELSLFLWFRGGSFCRPAHGFGSSWNSRHDLLPCHIFKPHRPSHDRLRDLCSVLSTWLPVNINQCVHNHNQHSSVFNTQHIDNSDSIFRHHSEYIWSVFGQYRTNYGSGSNACNEQDGAKAPPTSFPPVHGLPHDREDEQSGTRHRCRARTDQRDQEGAVVKVKVFISC